MRNMTEFKNEIIDILKSEVDRTDNPNFKNFLLNELEGFNHSYLIKSGFFGLQIPPMNKLPIEGGLQERINCIKNLQLIYLKNFKYNTNISDETREWLDIKVGKLYIKVGKLIDKLYVNKQKSYQHWKNNYEILTTN
jgi:hypothetical protein